MISCVDPDDNIAFPVGTIICSRTSTTTETTIQTETSTDSSEQTVTTSEQILGTTIGGSIQTTGPTTMIGDVRTSTSTAAASTRAACNINLEELSSVYNLDDLRKRCSEFHACTLELYKSENLHRILAGDNIQLRNICGLMYRNNNGSYRILEQQCSTLERESIKGFLEEELSVILNDPSKAEGSWGKLKTCLDKIPDNDEYINKLCRLKGNSAAPLCNARDVQSTTETFFNTRLRENHCQCDAVTSKTTTSSLSPLIGGVCGGSLILLLIVIIIVLCVRHRKLRRRLETESKRSRNKTSPTDGSCLPNQGIRDHSQASEARLMRDNPRHQPVGQAPRLPERYIPYQHPAPASPTDSNYIELLPDVACIYRQQGLPGDRGPEMFSDQRSPQDHPYDLAKHVAPSPATERRMRTECPSGRYDRPLEGGAYYETIDMKSGIKNKPQGGNNPLGLKRGPPEVRKRSQPLTRQAAESEDDGGRQCSNEQSYFEIEPADTTRV